MIIHFGYAKWAAKVAQWLEHSTASQSEIVQGFESAPLFNEGRQQHKT
jgi:hypothetical protein